MPVITQLLPHRMGTLVPLSQGARSDAAATALEGIWHPGISPRGATLQLGPVKPHYSKIAGCLLDCNEKKCSMRFKITLRESLRLSAAL